MVNTKKNSSTTLILIIFALIGIILLKQGGFIQSLYSFGGTTSVVITDSGNIYKLNMRQIQSNSKYATCDGEIRNSYACNVAVIGKDSYGCTKWSFGSNTPSCPSKYTLYDKYASKPCRKYVNRRVGYYYSKANWECVMTPLDYDSALRFNFRGPNTPAGIFDLSINNIAVAHYGESTLHPDVVTPGSSNDFSMRDKWVYNDSISITGVQYKYSIGGTECYDVKKAKTCQTWGARPKPGGAPNEIEEICVNWGGTNPMDMYETVHYCAEYGREFWVKGNFNVGVKTIQYCHGGGECAAIAENNGGNPDIFICTNTCSEFDIKNPQTCECIPTSEITVKNQTVEFNQTPSREGPAIPSGQILIQPGKNYTFTVLVDMKYFDTSQAFTLNLNARAYEYSATAPYPKSSPTSPSSVDSTPVVANYTWSSE